MIEMATNNKILTQLLNEGANIKVVSTLLGHSILRFTEKYLLNSK